MSEEQPLISERGPTGRYVDAVVVRAKKQIRLEKFRPFVGLPAHATLWRHAQFTEVRRLLRDLSLSTGSAVAIALADVIAPSVDVPDTRAGQLLQSAKVIVGAFCAYQTFQFDLHSRRVANFAGVFRAARLEDEAFTEALVASDGESVGEAAMAVRSGADQELDSLAPQLDPETKLQARMAISAGPVQGLEAMVPMPKFWGLD